MSKIKPDLDGAQSVASRRSRQKPRAVGQAIKETRQVRRDIERVKEKGRLHRRTVRGQRVLDVEYESDGSTVVTLEPAENRAEEWSGPVRVRFAPGVDPYDAEFVAEPTQSVIKDSMRTEIAFEDALDAVVQAVAANPDLAPVIESRLAEQFKREADVEAGFDQAEQDRIAALWAAEMKKRKNDPTRRNPRDFVVQECDIAGGYLRKWLPEKLGKAYGVWLVRNPDEEVVWPDVDRMRKRSYIDNMPPDEALRHLRKIAKDNQARRRLRKIANSL